MKTILPISLIMPILNEENNIRHTLDRIKKLEEWPEELIIIDAGSIDQTISIINNWFIKQEKIFKYKIIIEKNAFPGRGRNIGIRNANNDWIAFLDSGIIPDPNWLKELFNFVVTNKKNAAWGVCTYSSNRNLGKILCALGPGLDQVYHFFLASSLFHKSIFYKIGFFHDDIRASEDIYFMKRFRANYGDDYVCHNAKVSYLYFPETIFKVIKKWFSYARSIAYSRIYLKLQLAYILFFFTLIFSFFYNKNITWIIFLIYFHIRGMILPSRKSKNFFWFKKNIILLLMAPIIAFILDITKTIGYLNGHIRSFLTLRPVYKNRTLRIARIVSIPLAFVHFKKQLNDHKDKDVDTTLISSKGDYQNVLNKELGLDHLTVDIHREISPFKDLMALIRLYKLFITYRFDIVHSSTPKAGLLAAIAGFFAKVPIRIHTFTGQRWATLNGPKRILLRNIDKLIGILNTQIYTDSPSQTQYLIDEQIISPNKISTIHKGSLGGVDLNRFDINKFPNQNKIIKKELNIDDESKILIFVGRITRDKGIEELVSAFKLILENNIKADLLLLGIFEPKLDPINLKIKTFIENSPNIHFLGFKEFPEDYIAGSDIFCLPSYREGFGTVALEAAALKKPSVGTNISGLKDAIKDNQTGLLIPTKDIAGLYNALKKLIEDNNLRKIMGENALRRAKEDFEYSIIANELMNEYSRLWSQYHKKHN